MAELTTTAETTTNSCCAPEVQATCCDPSAKAECCDPSHSEGCGCSAGEAPASDIREQVGSATPPPRSRSRAPIPAPAAAHQVRRSTAAEVFGAALYALGDHEHLLDTAKLASLGCGNPTAVAELHEVTNNGCASLSGWRDRV
jgi:arsenite methyltransferase